MQVTDRATKGVAIEWIVAELGARCFGRRERWAGVEKGRQGAQGDVCLGESERH